MYNSLCVRVWWGTYAYYCVWTYKWYSVCVCMKIHTRAVNLSLSSGYMRRDVLLKSRQIDRVKKIFFFFICACVLHVCVCVNSEIDWNISPCNGDQEKKKLWNQNTTIKNIDHNFCYSIESSNSESMSAKRLHVEDVLWSRERTRRCQRLNTVA